MNIKSFLFIAQCFFDKIHPNLNDDEDNNSEIDPEVLDYIQNDYFYLQYCYQGLMTFINSNFESIKTD
jgi:hypothetical protein